MSKKNIITFVSMFALVGAGCGDETNTMPDPDAGPTEDGGPTDDGGPTGPEPRGEDNPPSLGEQIDRMARPAINTALNATFMADAEAKGEAKDAYNAAGQSDWSSFTEEFMANLAILDSLDTVCGNQLLADGSEERYATLASVLVDDQLYVNSESGTCGVYLGVEAEAIGAVGEGDGGCGGRSLADDVIDRSYSVLAAGILTGIDDTITEDDAVHSDTFPFLADPAE